MNDFAELSGVKEGEVNKLRSELAEKTPVPLADKSVQLLDSTPETLNRSQQCEEIAGSSSQEALKVKTAELAVLQATVESQETRLSSLMREREAHHSEMRRYAATIDNLKRIEFDEFVLLEEKVNLEEEIASLRTQLQKQVELVEELKQQLEKINLRVGQQESDISTLESTARRMEGDYEEKLVVSEKRATELSGKLSEEIRAKNMLKADLDEIMVTLQRRERGTKNQDEVNSENAQLKEALLNMDTEFTTFQESSKTVAAEKEQLKEALLNMDTDLMALQESSKTFAAEKERLKKSLDAVVSENYMLKSSMIEVISTENTHLEKLKKLETKEHEVATEPDDAIPEVAAATETKEEAELVAKESTAQDPDCQTEEILPVAVSRSRHLFANKLKNNLNNINYV